MTKATKIKSFDFEPGKIITGKYRIVEKLGAGWEGEVYKIEELYRKYNGGGGK